jgi:hypothetical protein
LSNLIIDPYVFACPQSNEGIDAFRNYIESIISWREFADEGWARVFVSEQTVTVLAETNSYPLWDSLKSAIAQLNIVDVQAKDIVDVVNALLQRLPSIETEFGLRDVLADSIVSNPEYHLATRPPIFVEQYYRIAIMVCLVAQVRGFDELSQVLITRLLNEDLVSSEIRATIHDCESSFEQGLENFPLHLQGRLQLCNTPHGLYLAVDPLDIWIGASSDQECAHALHLFLYQKVYKAKRERLSQDDLQWSMGDSFCESVMRLGFLANRGRMRTLLRACADTILRENLSQTRWLRTGSGAEDPQLERGTDRAWRRTIDHEYRLHYWETALGPELASVVAHNDMSIPF